MKRASTLLFLLCAAGLVCLGVALDRLSPDRWLAGLLTNPFGLTSSVTPGPVVLEQVQRLNRLETCRYQGQVLVTGENVGALPLWLAGDRMLFVGRGEVVAGVNLARLRPEDVHTEGRSVTLRLPGAEILHSRLDNAGSEVFERRSGIFTGPDADLESRVRLQAEQRIRQAALASGVLREADQNARDALRRHLELLGFRQVAIL